VEADRSVSSSSMEAEAGAGSDDIAAVAAGWAAREEGRGA
jgi:hypothetical protein